MADTDSESLSVSGSDSTVPNMADSDNESSVSGSESVSPVSATNISDQELKLNRALLTILHYILTYPRWSFSFFLLLASRSMPLPVAYESIRQPFQDLQLLAQQESQLYLECTIDAFDHLHRQLNETVATEHERVVLARDRNQRVVQQAQHAAALFHNHTVDARRVLHVWQLRAPLPLLNETFVGDFGGGGSGKGSTCSAQDYSNLTRLLGQDGDDSHHEQQEVVANAWEEYLEQSRHSLQHVTDYAQDRSNYDYHYFVGVKIQTTLDLMDELQRPELKVAFSINQQRIMKRLEEILQAIRLALEDAYVRVSLLTARIDDFHASILAFHANYSELYGRMVLVSKWMQDFWPGNKLPFFVYNDLPQADFMLPIVFQVPTFPNALPDVDILVTDYVQEALQIIMELVAELAEKASEETQEAIQFVVDKLKDSLTLEDYDPPTYVGTRSDNMQDENDVLFEQGETAMNTTLEALEKKPNVLDEDIATETIAFPNEKFQGSSLGGNTTTFDYFEPSFPSLSIPEFILALGSFILANQWIIEMVVQSVRLWRLRAKYERDASLDLPQIDFGLTDEEEDEHSKPGTLALLQLTFFKHFMTPWMALGLVFFPFGMVGVGLWMPYVKAQCIDSRDGTFVARNVIAPMLINKANVAGYTYHTNAEMQCRSSQRQQCNRMYADSDLLQRSDAAALFAAQQRFNESLDTVGLLKRCVNVDWMDDVMTSACCGLEGYYNYYENNNDKELDCSQLDQDESMCPIDTTQLPPAAFRPIGEYLSDKAVHGAAAPEDSTATAADADAGSTDFLWHLENARFDCDALSDTCQAVPCGGVDVGLIQSLAIDADCRAETYVILCCIFWLLALFYAIMWNLTCTLAFNGIKRLLWRRLRPAGIKLTTHVREDGELVSGGDVDERIARVSKAMAEFERVGWVQICLSGIIFVVWLISFLVLKRRVAEFTDYL